MASRFRGCDAWRDVDFTPPRACPVLRISCAHIGGARIPGRAKGARRCGGLISPYFYRSKGFAASRESARRFVVKLLAQHLRVMEMSIAIAFEYSSGEARMVLLEGRNVPSGMRALFRAVDVLFVQPCRSGRRGRLLPAVEASRGPLGPEIPSMGSRGCRVPVNNAIPCDESHGIALLGSRDGQNHFPRALQGAVKLGPGLMKRRRPIKLIHTFPEATRKSRTSLKRATGRIGPLRRTALRGAVRMPLW